ncbi:MAG: glycosyltransferase family 1 protein, partial [Leptolyngbyaceae cyanobacterium SM1_4_3]|nr:glycosyltransferase family 1 protein [Leptolyngbyaceae cyanobacterium SM1_4_3]
MSSLRTATEAGGAIDSTRDRRLMLFAPWCFGHHPIYLGHLIRHWCEQELPGTLEIVVLPAFLQAHPDVVNLPAAYCSSSVRFVAMTDREQADLETKDSGLERAFQQYHLICKYAQSLQATQALVMFFDSCQIPLVLGLLSPCPLSGLYFRPTFHYAQLGGYAPGWKERVQQWREKIFCREFCKNASFRTLFCLDPFATDLIRGWDQSSS